MCTFRCMHVVVDGVPPPVFDDNPLKRCAARQQGNLIFDGRADVCVIAAGLCVGHRLAGRVADGNGYHR